MRRPDPVLGQLPVRPRMLGVQLRAQFAQIPQRPHQVLDVIVSTSTVLCTYVG